MDGRRGPAGDAGRDLRPGRPGGAIAAGPAAARAGGLKVLYSIKACAVAEVLRRIAPHVDGFSASSLFEARLSREVLGGGGEVHVTSPAYAPAELEELARHADHINFNSIPQYERCAPLAGGSRRGLRINPQYSQVA